jgi:hypothetical protein
MHIGTTALLWALMVTVAIVNGIFGDKVAAKALGDWGAHIYKTALIITVIFVISYRYIAWLQSKGAASGTETALYAVAIAVGVQWLASSILFEFMAGHYIFGFSWERLFADYRIWEGRFWSLVLASEVAAPLVAAYILSKV